MKKRTHIWLAAAAAVIAVLAGTMIMKNNGGEKKEDKKSIRVGVALYRGDDPFINNIRSKLEEKAKSYEKGTGVKVVMDVADAKGNQNTQNSQVDRFLSLGYDAICVNMVDRSAASYVINKAMDADIPVIFFNREPVEEDMKRWEKLYYVGEDAKESAVLQGNILMDRSRVFPEEAPSVPRPTGIPASRSSLTGATPLPAFVLEPIQWLTETLPAASSLISSLVR